MTEIDSQKQICREIANLVEYTCVRIWWRVLEINMRELWHVDLPNLSATIFTSEIYLHV